MTPVEMYLRIETTIDLDSKQHNGCTRLNYHFEEEIDFVTMVIVAMKESPTLAMLLELAVKHYEGAPGLVIDGTFELDE